MTPTESGAGTDRYVYVNFFWQIHGDGGCAEKRDFTSGTCAAKVARVLSSARGRRRRLSDPPSHSQPRVRMWLIE